VVGQSRVPAERQNRTKKVLYVHPVDLRKLLSIGHRLATVLEARHILRNRVMGASLLMDEEFVQNPIAKVVSIANAIISS
jgi:ribosomal protein L14E/L6E/L27E